ncbi:MAG: hypothetical protein K6F17_05165 [Lachnospiraceae bacterium]|nr:hypothetical protein [Lachnospiraceae bacterium]
MEKRLAIFLEVLYIALFLPVISNLYGLGDALIWPSVLIYAVLFIAMGIDFARNPKLYISSANNRTKMSIMEIVIVVAMCACMMAFVGLGYFMGYRLIGTALGVFSLVLGFIRCVIVCVKNTNNG